MFSIFAPSPINYGAIGSLIGRDLVHVIDRIGRRYNEDGRRKTWWSSNFEEHYKMKQECYSSSYAHILNRNNITADLLIGMVEGLRLGLETLSASIKDTRYLRIPKKLNDYTFEQLYYISYAQVGLLMRDLI